MNDLNALSELAPVDVQKPRGRPFEPGNPGRPKGARNKRTMLVESWLGDRAEMLTDKIVERALHGDAVALRFCMARLVAPWRDHPVEFEAPEISTAADAVKAGRALLAACAEGKLSPREAIDLVELIKNIRGLEIGDFEARLTEVENQLQG
jgi:hypothetical protein